MDKIASPEDCKGCIHDDPNTSADNPPCNLCSRYWEGDLDDLYTPRIPRKRVKGYSRRKPDGKYKTIKVRGHLRSRKGG